MTLPRSYGVRMRLAETKYSVNEGTSRREYIHKDGMYWFAYKV